MDNVDNHGMGADQKKLDKKNKEENMIMRGLNDEESSNPQKKISYTTEKQSSFQYGVDYVKNSMSKVIGKPKDKLSDDENDDPCTYIELEDHNTEPNRNVNFTTIKDNTKTVWTSSGP